VIIVDGSPRWATLELPDKSNQQNVSCIPLGTYKCPRVDNRVTKGGLRIPTTFFVSDVPNRGGILFHIGNRASDSNGCILIGQGYSEFKGVPWIINSRVGFDDFIDYMKGTDEFLLKIEKFQG